MLSSRWLLVPFVLHGLCMAVDEFYFHWRRGLPRWERLGHPLDTLSAFFCQGWLCLNAPSLKAVGVYIALSVFSCLLVTKDEFVHRVQCSAGEQWLHAVMFVLHPVILISAALVWAVSYQQLSWFAAETWEATMMQGYLLSIALFGLYQLVFWNVLWQRFSNRAQ